MGPFGCQNCKAKPGEMLRRLDDGRFVIIRHGNEHRSFSRQALLRSLLGLVKCKTERAGHPQDLAGRTHFRTQERVGFRKHIKGKYRFLDAKVGDWPRCDVKFR